MRRLTRSEFLKAAALTGAGAAFLAACGGKSGGVTGDAGSSAAPGPAAREMTRRPIPRATCARPTR